MRSLVSQKEISNTDFYNFPKHCFITVVATSNKILTLKALLYLKPTFSLQSELPTTVPHTCVDLSAEVKLTGKAGWKSPWCSSNTFQ